MLFNEQEFLGDNEPILEVLIVHTNNTSVFQQMDMIGDKQHIVVVCTKGTGYVIVGSTHVGDKLVINKRWEMEFPGAVSFSVPADASVVIARKTHESLLSRYPVGRSGWETVCRAKQWDGIMPVSRGNTVK